MEVLELQDQDSARWDEYVCGAEPATVFQLAGWRDVMRETFGLAPHYLFAVQGDEIRGVLPLFHVQSKLLGDHITSMPNAICADDVDTAYALVERAKKLVKTSQARYLILRDSHHKWDLPALVTTENHCSPVVRLAGDPSDIWMEVSRGVRRSVNKATGAGLEVATGPQYLREFYPIYSRAMRDRGTPTQGLTFFTNVFERFPACFTVVIVRRDEQVLGGGIVACFKDTLYHTWGGMLPEFYELRTNYILYWDTLRFGCENGFHWADLGRSAWESGTYQFKMHWAAEPRPLYQQFYLNGTPEPPPVGNSRADQAQHRLFSAAWKRIPLWAAEFLGPQLRKRVPFG